MMSESQSGCWTNGQNSGMSAADHGSGEIMLFGVRVKVDPMRKSVSMNDLSQYVQPATHDSSSNSNNLDGSAAVAADIGYASADDAVRNHSNGGRERKRGVPWTKEEHKLFLLGLQKVGKGDWRGISRNFVTTRTPTQVASHAQKYFLRRSNLNRRRRRSSLFDITTDSVAGILVEEEQVQEDNNSTQPAQSPMMSSQHMSPLSGFPMAAFPATVGPIPIPSPVRMENQMETATFSNGNQLNSGSTQLVSPIPLLPTPDPSITADLKLNQKHERDPLSLSLSLSLSYNNNRWESSAFQVISGFNNGDGLISVG
ncbi:transcription factor MYB1R1-like [Cynara cardunculus var. scolymus]|nr:transcription factor MYB1R1-like [Cynara cardunculus var. scolymus]